MTTYAYHSSRHRRALLLALLSTLLTLVALCAVALPTAAFAMDEGELREAVAAAPTDGAQTVIDVNGRVSISSPITITSGQNVVIRSSNNNGSLRAADSLGNGKTVLMVEGGAALTLDDGIVVNGCDKTRCLNVAKGGSASIKTNAIVCNGKADSGAGVYCAGELTLDGGRIGDCRATSSGGGVYVDASGSFTMYDGSINTNSAGSFGAGVANRGTFTLSGGSIEHNVAEKGASGGWVGGGGGGVCSWGSFHMSGGSVDSNEASSMGGGVYVYIEGAGKEFLVTGGSVTNNRLGRGGGGGIYVWSRNGATSRITACTISGNSSRNLGGGIYVGQKEDSLYLENVLVTGNEASRLGGGIWTCSTGTVQALERNGIAVYGNTASSEQGTTAGDDVVVNDPVGSGGKKNLLSALMLGGGANSYHYDGQLDGRDGSVNHGPLAGSERFLPDGTTDLWDGDSSGFFALHNDPSSSAMAKAEAKAKVIISGNSAVYGGGIGANGQIITGNDEYTSLKVRKVWTGKGGSVPSEITVTLLANGSEAAQATLYASDEWTRTDEWFHVFEGLPMEDDAGNAIAYSIEEDEVEGFFTSYETSVASDGSTEVTITNEAIPTTEATVRKVWDDADDQDGIRPESIIVTLSDGTEVELSAANDWSATVEGLPALDKDRNKVSYSWTESSMPEGYELAGTEVAGTVTTITNSHAPEVTEATVCKVWDDDSNRDGLRPSSVTVRLQADGADTEHTLTLNAANGWTATVKGLDKCAAGSEIAYTWVEDPVPGGYELSSTTKGTVTTLTNTHVPKVTKAKVTKVWNDAGDQDGLRPTSVTVSLLANGKQVESAKLTESNSWTYTWENLPANEAGTKISYSLAEVDVPAGYTSSSAGGFSSESGVVITNTHKPATTSIAVTKVWDDANNQSKGRPEAITVRLFADGEQYGDAVTLSAAGLWRHIWTDLPQYKGGKKVSYTVLEDEVSGYTATVTGTAADGYTITNTRQALTPPKTPTPSPSKKKSTTTKKTKEQPKAAATTQLPKTADDSTVGIASTLAIIGAAAVIAGTGSRAKSKKR